jgi:hypothetical protein
MFRPTLGYQKAHKRYQKHMKQYSFIRFNATICSFYLSVFFKIVCEPEGGLA